MKRLGFLVFAMLAMSFLTSCLRQRQTAISKEAELLAVAGAKIADLERGNESLMERIDDQTMEINDLKKKLAAYRRNHSRAIQGQIEAERGPGK